MTGQRASNVYRAWVGVVVSGGAFALATAAYAVEWKSGIQWQEPPAVDPGGPAQAPSDAIVLFGGDDCSAFEGGENCKIEEGAFTICSFWLVSALVEIGEVSRARHLCEKLLSFASPLHLYAEEIEPSTGRHLGNFPQAFTHLALINAVVHVIRAEEQADGTGVFQPANSPT